MEKARSIAFTEHHAWVGQNLVGMELLDIRNPSLPRRIKKFKPEEIQPLDIRVLDDDVLVIADRFRGLVLWDVSTPRTPVPLGSVKLPGIATSVDVTKVRGKRIAAVACGGEGMASVDITDPRRPVLLGLFQTRIDYSRRLVLDGNVAYLADHFDGGLKVLDLKNPSSPKPFFQVSIRGFCESVSRRGSLLAVGYRNYGFRLFEISSLSGEANRDKQTTPVLRLQCNSVRTRSEVRDLLPIGDNLLLVANDVNGLELYDVSNRKFPLLLDEYEFGNAATAAQSVKTHSGHIYVPSWDGGLYILRIVKESGFDDDDDSNTHEGP